MSHSTGLVSALTLALKCRLIHTMEFWPRPTISADASAEAAIRDVHDSWIDGVNTSDLVCLLVLMTDDAVFLNPGEAPFGRDAFSTHFSAAHQQVQIRCISALEEVVVVGDVAYTRSRDSLSVTPHAGGDATALVGYRMSVYRKQHDGRWLLARDAHTLLPVSR